MSFRFRDPPEDDPWSGEAITVRWLSSSPGSGMMLMEGRLSSGIISEDEERSPWSGGNELKQVSAGRTRAIRKDWKISW